MRKKLKTIKLAKIRRLIRQICRKYPNPKEIEKTTLKVYDIAIGKMSKEKEYKKGNFQKIGDFTGQLKLERWSA